MDEATANDSFSKKVVETIAKRAGNMCSNPDCKALTSGPAQLASASVSVGEAAHIFGARPGSARYRAEMTSGERSDATNAIWLCRNCHKVIDTDQLRYPHELLYEWRREHEEEVQAILGKAGARLRHKASDRLLEGFQQESYLAQQIILDKPYAWEYRLTTEMLRTKMEPVQSRWRSLSRGLYTKPISRIEPKRVFDWWRDRLHELTTVTPAFSALMNDEFAASWGAPGEPGSAGEIQRVCNLFVENCARLLEWEEQVRFVRLPDSFEAMQPLLIGIGGRLIDQVSKVPAEMAKIFQDDEPEGVFTISVVIELPDGWEEECQDVFDHLVLMAKHDPGFWED